MKTKSCCKTSTREDRKFIIDNYGKMSAREIAEYLGVSRNVVYKYAHLAGIKTTKRDIAKRGKGVTFTDEQKKRIAEMVKVGKGSPAIARELNIAYPTLYSYMRHNGLISRTNRGVRSDCDPPYSCFSCSSEDCIAVANLAITPAETEFLRIGMIGTVVSKSD